MFSSSVVLYLFVRKANYLKIPSQYNNLAMFVIPLFLFFFMTVITNQSFSIQPIQFFTIVLVAVFFSYLGNLFSLISIENAPNPGYSLIISKSYVVFTTLVAVLLFKSEINLQKIIAILLIVFFSLRIIYFL